jgi:hypothetical protein
LNTRESREYVSYFEDFSFEKDTIGHIFTGQYYGLHGYISFCHNRTWHCHN